MSDFRPWLIPTLLGPIAGTCGLTALLLIVLDPGSEMALALGTLGIPFDAWVLAMFMSAVVGAGLAFWLLVADVVLLSLQWRKLAVGVRASR